MTLALASGCGFVRPAGQSASSATRHRADGSASPSPSSPLGRSASPTSRREVIGPGLAAGNRPQVGYHTSGRVWRPIFVEGYTAGPALWTRVKTESPGTYPGPFSPINAQQAVFIGWCSACSVPASPSPRAIAAVPMAIALYGGAVLLRRGQVGELSYAMGAAFLSASDGWVTGLLPAHRTVSAIEHTTEGGRNWQLQYVLRH